MGAAFAALVVLSGDPSNPAEVLEQVAEFVAWLARNAPVPADGSVVLIEWAREFVPLRPDITAAELLAVGPRSA